jgi:HD superfamily phosphodiesterase
MMIPPGPFEFPVCRLVEHRVRVLVDDERQSIAHRIDHFHRVAHNARAIMASYPDADAEVLYLAVLLHDVDQPFYDKKITSHAVASWQRRCSPK